MEGLGSGWKYTAADTVSLSSFIPAPNQDLAPSPLNQRVLIKTLNIG